MNNSKEELIDMTELSSPNKTSSYLRPKKRNKIHSPPFVSPAHSVDKDVTSLFSVKKSSKITSYDDDTETISEFSDDVFSEQSLKNFSRSDEVPGSSKSKSRQSKKINKLKLSMEKIRRESSEIDANVQSVRSRLSLGDKRDGKPEFSFFSSVKEDLEEKDEEELIEYDKVEKLYNYPENLCFNIELSEKELLFIPNSKALPLESKSVEDHPRFLEEEGLYVGSNLNISQKRLSVLEKRLLSVEDKKWFNCEGKLTVLSNPILDRSIKPDIEVITGEGTIYYSPKHDVDMEEVLVVKEKILELSLNNLKFSHHPLFSLEHILQEKLREAFKKYSTSIENNTLQKLRNQMEALRHAKKLKKVQKDEILKDIKVLRENIFQEGKMQRDNLKIIFDTWKGIKYLRQEQKYSNTTVRLLIKKEKLPISEEKASYEKFFKDTLQDILEEHRHSYKKKLREYNKRIKAKEEAINSAKSDSDENENDEDDLEKPVYDIDEKKIQLQLRKKIEESFKPPGEPNLILFLKDDNEITENVENEQENARRKVVLSTKITFKILCNGILVCKSKPVSLNDSFVLEVNEMFAIQLTDVPKFLSIIIFEHPKGLLKKRICELSIDMPNDNAFFHKSKCNELGFEKKEIVHYKHAGVGSGYSFKKMTEEREVALDVKIDTTGDMNTAGFLSFRTGWQKSQSATSDGFLENSDCLERQISKVINKWGAVDEHQLELWLEGRPPDPQDPRNSAFFEYLELNGSDGEQHWKQKNKEYFRLNPYAEKMTFCNMDDINQNVRFQCLKLRDQNEIEFDGVTIPNRIREIPFELLRDYKKRKAIEAIQDDDLDTDLDTLRDAGTRRLKQIHTKIFQMCKRDNNNLSYESVVDEKYLIYLEEVVKTSLKNLLNWFRWQPNLSKPLPRITKNSDSFEAQQQLYRTQTIQNKILIQILSGKNIPKTKSVKKKVNEETTGLEREVRPFLEISYDDFLTRTSVKKGSDPVWNELVELSLKHHQTDYLNPNALSGSISIDLFDYLDSDNEPSREIDNKFWLGDIRIPLSALTTGLQLNGWFKVQTPPIIFGYETNEDQLVPKSPKLTTTQNSSDNETYIELNIHISPSIPLLEPNTAELPNNDIPYIKDHVTKWNEIFNSSFPSKKFNVLALDIRGRTNCITRYIRPLEPPQLNTEEFDVTPEQCLRYVSLIPFTECNHFYQNIWLSTEQLLQFMIGSGIDHCVALTCFLLALKVEAYLLLGYGIPNGSTAYVLLPEYSRENQLPNYLILDVVYNKTFYLTDPLCPLQKVFCVVNGENVWGNAQRTQNPALLRFDLSRKSDWWPLFNNVVSAPSNSLNNSINFAITEDYLHIERQLERKLKRKFSKWRPMDRTTFNYKVSEAAKNALRFFEINAMYSRSNTEAMIELNKANSQYNVTGMVLNMSFTNIPTIVKKIKHLHLHLQQPDITEFALSVLIQSYPGRVLSVWIFLETVTNKFSD